MRLLLWLILLTFGFLACTTSKEGNMDKRKLKVKDTVTNNGTQIITAPIVHKEFMQKNGVPSGRKEIYIRGSTQDYFVKFCESKAKREDILRYLSSVKGEVKTLTMEVEFRDGYWDICDENFMQQSRMGEYVVIHSIVEKS